MRLVFVLYAEDRDLLPSRLDGRPRNLRDQLFRHVGLYARLVEDAAIIRYHGHGARAGAGTVAVPADPRRPTKAISSRARAASCSIRGVCVPRGQGRCDRMRRGFPPFPTAACCASLEGLRTLQRGATRERLSYRALDVEQDRLGLSDRDGLHGRGCRWRGLAIKAGKNKPHAGGSSDLEKLLGREGKGAFKFLKDAADRGALSAAVAKAVEGAKTIAELAPRSTR